MHNAHRLPQAEKKKLSERDGRTTRGKAKALGLVAGEAPSAMCDLLLGKKGTFTVDTKFEASLEQLTTDIGRKIRKNTFKQNGFDCMPIALATECVVNPFAGKPPGAIRVMSADAIKTHVDSGLYGRKLVKDVLTTNADVKKSWDTVIDETTTTEKWLGKMELDALARVHETEIMTAQKTGKGTYAVLKFGQFHTFGVGVTSAQEIADFKGPILLNKSNKHWEAIAPVQRAAAVTAA